MRNEDILIQISAGLKSNDADLKDEVTKLRNRILECEDTMKSLNEVRAQQTTASVAATNVSCFFLVMCFV